MIGGMRTILLTMVLVLVGSVAWAQSSPGAMLLAAVSARGYACDRVERLDIHGSIVTLVCHNFGWIDRNSLTFANEGDVDYDFTIQDNRLIFLDPHGSDR